MSNELLSMITVFYFFITLGVVLTVLFLIRRSMKRQYSDSIVDLERNKNLIISGSILAELNKVESLINNEDLKEKYDYWRSRFKEIRDIEVPHITDDIIEAEEILKGKKFHEVIKYLAKIEFDTYIVKSKAQQLLDDIKEITLSEQKNREIVTALKTEYRAVFLKYNNAKEDYSLIQIPLELQFENVDKLFSTFEKAMENNVYTEVGKIVKALGDTIGNLRIVIDEAPSIILMGKNMIPNSIKDISKINDKMLSEGYNLDYLKIEYNIEEAEKKVADIFDRLNVLNLEESVFELRTILDYFDRLYADFEKEKIAKKLFDEYIRSVAIKCKKLKEAISGLVNKISDIKYSYNLTDDDVLVIEELDKEIKVCKEKYDDIVAEFRTHEVAYSRLSKEMDAVNKRLVKAEKNLNYTLHSIESLKRDEIRAREQLDEIRDIVAETKINMSSYKLPVVPKEYFVELDEANEAIANMVQELHKTPISIKVLNVRVDTARDLVLRVYNTSMEIVKTASMAENAIVYGNRYRSLNPSINSGLTKAEREFFKGNFKSSLEYAINSINVVEPGIHSRLVEAYKKES